MNLISEQAIQTNRYPAYKDSGIDWLGEIPAYWEVKRLKNVSNMLVSNVDKHTKPNEISVRLCNYVDVYKNNFITKDIAFLDASASIDEIEKFKIKNNDVIITKDSEDWLDIGVPALVKYEADDLICGYHLAILRAKKDITGPFLYHLLQSSLIRTQLSVKANGVTRYGLSHQAIQNISLPTPPLSEQTRIAEFLDRKMAQIDQAIAQKERLIDLLNERRQVLIHRAVTRGLDPNAPMKDSGIEWIGEIPAHWEVKKLKYILEERNEKSETGLETLFMVSQEHGLVVRSDYHDKAIAGQSSIGSKRVFYNDLVFNKLKAHLGVFFKSTIEEVGLVSPDYAVYYSNGTIDDLKYLELLFRHPAYIRQFICSATGIVEGLIRLYTGDLFNIRIPVPPKNEQKEILEYVNTFSKKSEHLLGKTQKEIRLLQELKATLINSAVTGKIKV